jgi:hypothetical protein
MTTPEVPSDKSICEMPFEQRAVRGTALEIVVNAALSDVADGSGWYSVKKTHVPATNKVDLMIRSDMPEGEHWPDSLRGESNIE